MSERLGLVKPLSGQVLQLDVRLRSAGLYLLQLPVRKTQTEARASAQVKMFFCTLTYGFLLCTAGRVEFLVEWLQNNRLT